MRPCNQCRQPVENSVLICEECARFNAEQGIPAESNEPFAPQDEELAMDHSYSILMGAFSCIITALCALVGLAIYNWSGLLVGGAIGLLTGVIMFMILIRF